MYCRFCGIQIEDNSKFCHRCGNSITEINDNSQINKTIASRLDFIYKHPKDVIYFLWWTLLVFIISIIVYNDNEDFVDVIPLLPIYFGVILLVCTIRFYKKKQDSANSNQEIAKERTEYSLQDFADIYGKMQICRYQDEYGVTRSKCVFTRSIDVYFSKDIGELNAKDVATNSKILLVQKQRHGDDYLLIVKDGAKIVKHPSTSVPPPLDKISDKISDV